MRRPDNRLSASHVLVAGGTGSGKSRWIRKHVIKAGEKRILLWDGKDEYGGEMGFERITSAAELHRVLASGRNGRFAYAVPVSREQFAFWSQAAYAWGHCLAVAEELADVTTPSKAPQAWGELIRKGRGHGVRTASATQRIAEVDKTIVGNATAVCCGYMPLELDREYVAKRLGLPRGELEALTPGDYVYQVMPNGPIQRGRNYPKKRK